MSCQRSAPYRCRCVCMLYGLFGVTDGYCPRLDGFTDHRPYLLTPATMLMYPARAVPNNRWGLGFSVLGLFVFLDHAGHWPFPTFVISVVVLRNLVGLDGIEPSSVDYRSTALPLSYKPALVTIGAHRPNPGSQPSEAMRHSNRILAEVTGFEPAQALAHWFWRPARLSIYGALP